VLQILERSFAEIKLTQIDIITPSGLKTCDSLPTLSSSVNFPGIFNESSTLNLKTGFFKKPNHDKGYLWQPLTAYDNNTNLMSLFMPYISATKPFKALSSGLYFGNIKTSSTTHNAFSLADSIKSFENSGIKMNGALWLNPNIKYLKGISLWAEGGYQKRDVHFGDIDDWKRIHTLFNYKRKHGKGLLSSTFSFIDKHYSILRFKYGKDIVTANETQLDTLFFSNDSYLTSEVEIDSSFEESEIGIEMGHIIRTKNYCMGLFIGGDRSNVDYEDSEKDSSKIFINAFYNKGFSWEKLLFYTGADFTYSGTLYKKSINSVGYIDLMKEYTIDRMAHSINLSIPLFAILKINSKLKLMTGLDFSFNYLNTNYDFKAGINNKSKHSAFDYQFYPLNVRYSPNTRLSISVNPYFDKDILIGGLDICYTF
jgi:hypothetical protein